MTEKGARCGWGREPTAAIERHLAESAVPLVPSLHHLRRGKAKTTLRLPLRMVAAFVSIHSHSPFT